MSDWTYRSEFPLKNGTFFVSMPRAMSEGDVEDVKRLMEILLRQASKPFIPCNTEDTK